MSVKRHVETLSQSPLRDFFFFPFFHLRVITTRVSTHASASGLLHCAGPALSLSCPVSGGVCLANPITQSWTPPITNGVKRMGEKQ